MRDEGVQLFREGGLGDYYSGRGLWPAGGLVS